MVVSIYINIPRNVFEGRQSSCEPQLLKGSFWWIGREKFRRLEEKRD
jgi:hypothetical protein